MSNDSNDLFNQSLSESLQGLVLIYVSPEQAIKGLNELWDTEPKLTFFSECYSPNFEEQVHPKPWSIGFTPTFKKSIASVDKKLQGRVLVAISELAEEPLTPKGDTIKPLIGQYNGLWRYRIGDYRLIYEAKEKQRVVVLHHFSARGEAYEH